MNNNKLVILVVSCDKYSDVWPPFFGLFEKFWPDCPFQIYLLTNYISSVPYHGVKCISVGKDISWSANLIQCLNILSEDYVFMIIDDLLFDAKVNTKKIIEVLEWMIATDSNYMRLSCSPRADKKYNELVGIISPGTIYRTSTVMSVWKKEILKNLLEKNENAWQFEVAGSLRSDKYDKFYATNNLHFRVINSVIKGKWHPDAIKKISNCNISVDLKKRKVMNFRETSIFRFKVFRSFILNLMPAKFRRFIKIFFLKDGSHHSKK